MNLEEQESTLPKPSGSLVVEQGLFSKSAQKTETSTDEENENSAEEIAEEDASEYTNDGSLMGILKSNLFWVILVPMVLIELVLLILIILK